MHLLPMHVASSEMFLAGLAFFCEPVGNRILPWKNRLATLRFNAFLKLLRALDTKYRTMNLLSDELGSGQSHHYQHVNLCYY